MERIGMFDAKTRFSEIVRRVRRTGKPITITNRGEEIARIVPIAPVEPEEPATHDHAVAAIAEIWRTLPPTTREENRRDLEEGRR